MRSFRSLGSGSSPAALPALLRASHLFGLALGSALGRLRESGVTAARLFERAEESALLLRMMREAAGILGARWDKVPERHRPHYAPEQRFRILHIRSFLGISQRETAEMFRVSTETIAQWEVEAMGADREVARPLVSTDPPVRRFADVVRAVIKTMELAGFGGNDLIARTLARAGWKVSARTVGRIRRERRPARRGPEAASTVPRAVRAKRPNHVWMVDLTDVKGLFGLVTFKVAVVFDAFSRMPLSVTVFSKEASADEIARFVSRTANRHGRPAHFVSDQARCFKGQVFRRKLRGAWGEAEVRGNREEGLDRADRVLVADAQGHARPAPDRAARGGRSHGEDRDRPPTLRTLPPASGSRRSDASRGLLRSDVGASVGDPASSRKAGRRPDRLTVLRRVPRYGAAAARVG